MELRVPEKEIEYKASVGDDGNVVLKKKSKIKMGSKSRARGGQFELRVRKDLEEKGWTVDKWSNNVDLDLKKVVPCRRVFKRFGVGKGVMTIGTGFPDFVAFDRRDNLFEVIGIEVKTNGTLSREEKLKCSWLLEYGIFSQILIASKKQERKGGKVRVEYLDFLEIKKRMR
ncbi:hypothetical protein HN903_03660 [archaeon]|nr:hypothetical protein [archaeon]MBT7128826.1 hypothetical protein [archaeon]